MRSRGKVREHIRQNVVGYIALFCFAIGGTAVALPGQNKVDSGDIKPKNVKTSDLANGAVTTSKLRANAVDSDKVVENALTGSDIDESSLSVSPSGAASGDLSGSYPNPELGPGVVGEAESADRERRILITPSEMVQTSEINDNPQIFATSGYQEARFADNESNILNAITQVPLDRAADSSLQIRLHWRGGSAANVVWQVGAQMAIVGTDPPGVPAGADVVATSPANGILVETLALEIPANALINGTDLGIKVTRDGPDGADTLSGDARLSLVEVRYTATG